MADIQKYIPILKEFEGTFVNNEHDQGGATNIGVTLNTFRTFFGEDKTVEDLKAITDEQLATVIKSYWDAVSGDKITDQQIANSICDWGYNSGQGTAISHLQEILGIPPPHGFFGNITLEKVNSADAATLANAICDSRIDFYKEIVENSPSQQIFLEGWVKRANALRYKFAV